MNAYLQLLAAFAGSAGFALAYNFRGKKYVLAAGFGGFAGWLCYLILQHITGNEYLSGYLSTVLVSLYAQTAAYFLKSPATGLLIVASIPMIPGASLYRCMQDLLRSETALFREEGTYTVLFASCMAAGFVTADLLVRLIRSAKNDS